MRLPGCALCGSLRPVGWRITRGPAGCAQVMTKKPETTSLETTIVDALHIMHDGRFLHLPVVDKSEGRRIPQPAPHQSACLPRACCTGLCLFSLPVFAHPRVPLTHVLLCQVAAAWAAWMCSCSRRAPSTRSAPSGDLPCRTLSLSASCAAGCTL